jgi:hypothetical protein
MSFVYKNYTLNSYKEEPWYATEVTLFETIIAKLPDADKTYVNAEHHHNRLSAPLSDVSSIVVAEAGTITLPNQALGVLTVSGAEHTLTTATDLSAYVTVDAVDVTYAKSGWTAVDNVKIALDDLKDNAITMGTPGVSGSLLVMGGGGQVFNSIVTQASTTATVTGSLAVTGDIYTTDWVNWSTAAAAIGYTGWTGTLSSNTYYYKIVGSTVHIKVNIEGTSNSTSTLIPFPANLCTAGSFFFHNKLFTFKNAGVQSAAPGLVAGQSINVLVLYTDCWGAAWGVSGTKQVLIDESFQIDV